jgi:hypothetical protein
VNYVAENPKLSTLSHLALAAAETRNSPGFNTRAGAATKGVFSASFCFLARSAAERMAGAAR